MKNITILAVSLGAIGAATALVLSIRSSVTADSFVGYASILGLLGMAALEYRVNWKRLIGRS